MEEMKAKKLAGEGLKEFFVHHFDAAFHYLLEEDAIEELTHTFNYEAKVLLLFSLFPGFFCGLLSLLDIDTSIIIWFAVIGTSYFISKNEETDEDGKPMYANQGITTSFFWYRFGSIILVILGLNIMKIFFRALTFAFESFLLNFIFVSFLNEYILSLTYLGIYRLMTSMSIATIIKFGQLLKDDQIQDLPIDEYQAGQRYVFKKFKKPSEPQAEEAVPETKLKPEPDSQTVQQGQFEANSETPLKETKEETGKDEELFVQFKAQLADALSESEDEFHSGFLSESILENFDVEEVKKAQGDHNFKLDQDEDGDGDEKTEKEDNSDVNEVESRVLQAHKRFIQLVNDEPVEKLAVDVRSERFMGFGNFLPFQSFLKASGKLVQQTETEETNENEKDQNEIEDFGVFE